MVDNIGEDDNEKLEIDIEPNSIDEENHLYVTITDYNGTVYEGRLYPNKSEENK